MHNPSPNRCLVFDLDTTLPFPTYFHKYVTETFRSDYAVSEDHHRFFRVIPADEYLTTFSSDRRHMKRPDGSWIKVRAQIFDRMTHMMYFLIQTLYIQLSLHLNILQSLQMWVSINRFGIIITS